MNNTLVIVAGTASVAISGIGSWIASKARYERQQDIRFERVMDAIKEMKSDMNRNQRETEKILNHIETQLKKR